MIRAFTLSLAQLGDPRILKVLAKTLALTLLIFIAIAAALWFAFPAAIAWFGWGETAQGFAAAASVVLTILGAWLLFRAVAIAVLGLFAEDVVIAVEDRHYPDALSTARAPRWSTAVRMSLASAARAVLFNLLASPVYILLLVTGIGTAIAFAIVNGWLLGRDLGEMVAVRHMPKEAVGGWLATTRTRRFLLGLVVTGLFVVPGVNLFAPIIGAAMAAHLFHAGWRK
jgi:CysZ protein